MTPRVVSRPSGTSLTDHMIHRIGNSILCENKSMPSRLGAIDPIAATMNLAIEVAQIGAYASVQLMSDLVA